MKNLNNEKLVEMVNYVLFNYDLPCVIFDEFNQEEEFINESKEICKYIQDKKNINVLELANEVQTTFFHYFETMFAYEDCYDIASDIMSNLDLCKEVM